MESRVKNFLDEINELIPLKKTSPVKKDSEWTECFDSKSGFSYYWNTRTNEVTWEKPKNYVCRSSVKAPITNIPDIKDKVKIYRISATQSLPKSNGNLSKSNSKKVPEKKQSHSESDDEKITLITSYGSSSGSESENEVESATITTSTENKASMDKEEDILSDVVKRAEELKKLGNAVVKTVPMQSERTSPVSKKFKPLSGFSLVAGYDTNSEDESEDEAPKVAEENPSTSPQLIQSHSTLFPIMKAPDLKDFELKRDIPNKDDKDTMNNSFDMKNFKRKRRLGVNFVPKVNNPRPPSPKTLDSERKGLGFKDSENGAENQAAERGKGLYANFTSGGLEFVKPEGNDDGKTEESEDFDEKKITEVYQMLREKLAFLCEGNKDVMPVQIILIQIETLYGALKAASLDPKYLQDWLEGTRDDLIKLEKEAAPEGWSLRWDRLQKRYYYQNGTSGQTQWEFPQEEFERQEEAMDICTTPPPPDITEPQIEDESTFSNQIPSPPPAPFIGKLDSEPPEPPSISSNILPAKEPLPPGVDNTESISQDKKDIDSAFNSFYSELAEIEKTSKPCSPTHEHSEPAEKVEESAEPVKKKRKKMKLGQGLSLRKKDVSKLVEKWKNVQNNYK